MENVSTQSGRHPKPPRIYGQPVIQLPLDLYIPPDAMQVMLDAFEGPLDLLLYLIRKANIDVLDIPMTSLTEQYLVYVEAMRAVNLELAAEYLLMASMLIEIKSRMLLPAPVESTEEEAGDPRVELVRRLIEYEQMKFAALKVNDLPHAQRDFYWAEALLEESIARQLPEVQPRDLHTAWQNLLLQAKLTQHHNIARQELSVREHMSSILRCLDDHHGYVEFSTLFNPLSGVSVLVVHFLALLELVREGYVEITQTASYAPIHVITGKATCGSGTPRQQ